MAEYASSGDEAPEEVALSIGKTQEASRRKQERATQAEQQQLQKRGKRGQPRARAGTLQPEAVLPSPPPEAEGDDLPEEVIETLTRESRYNMNCSIPFLHLQPWHVFMV